MARDGTQVSVFERHALNEGSCSLSCKHCRSKPAPKCPTNDFRGLMLNKKQSALLIAMAITLALCGVNAYAEADPPPINDLPNPYETIAPWGDLPHVQTW